MGAAPKGEAEEKRKAPPGKEQAADGDGDADGLLDLLPLSVAAPNTKAIFGKAGSSGEEKEDEGGDSSGDGSDDNGESGRPLYEMDWEMDWAADSVGPGASMTDEVLVTRAGTYQLQWYGETDDAAAAEGATPQLAPPNATVDYRVEVRAALDGRPPSLPGDGAPPPPKLRNSTSTQVDQEATQSAQAALQALVDEAAAVAALAAAAAEEAAAAAEETQEVARRGSSAGGGGGGGGGGGAAVVLVTGGKVRVLSPTSNWRTCTVLALSASQGVRVHYDGYAAQYDEWIGRGSARLDTGGGGGGGMTELLRLNSFRDFPRSWQALADDAQPQTYAWWRQVHLLDVARSHKDFERMQTGLRASPLLKSCTLVRLRRVQSRLQWRGFLNKRGMMALKNSAERLPSTERLLFHGTADTPSEEVVCSEEGPDQRFATPGGLGRGIYGTSKAERADAKAHCPKAGGVRELLILRMLVGVCKNYGSQEQKTMTVPPLKPKGSKDRYDSCRGGENDSPVYVVYDHTSVYPEFILTYKK
jgi:hypothetical protein